MAEQHVKPDKAGDESAIQRRRVKKRSLWIASFLLLVGVVILFVLGNVIRLEPLLEKVETQDPGYLRMPVRILERSTHEALTFDATKQKSATISYKLTKPARMRLRVVRKDQRDLVLRTLLDWEPQKLGKNEVRWDGRDASGNIIDNTKCLIVFEGDDTPHIKHERDKCHELALKITSPSEAQSSVSGTTKITAEVTGDTAYVGTSGYKVRFYVDYNLKIALRCGSAVTSFNHDWDTTEHENGEHIVTVVADDCYDHVGTASIKLNVQN